MVFYWAKTDFLIRFLIVSLTAEDKNKEYEEEAAKLEAKYKVEEDIKRDDKDKKKSERLKKKEKEKAKLRERSNKITEGDLMKVLEFLNPKEKPKITEVRDMIWEVDEDMDKCIDAAELEKMYKRCSRDTEWLEPRKLFNLIQFLMFLSDFTRKDITSEDTLQLLFIRYRSDRNALDESVTAIFGPGKGKDDKGNEIHLDYMQYLEKVNKMALDNYKLSKKSKEQALKGSTFVGGKSSFVSAGKSQMTH